MDPKHNDKKIKLRKTGKILLIIGGVFSLVGFVDFFVAIGNMGMPNLFWCLFIGFPLLGIGGMLLKVSYIRETAQYIKDESVPVTKDLYRDLKPEIKDFVNTLRGKETNDEIICPRCGTRNDLDNNFCKGCGEELNKKCPHCGETLDHNSSYCGRCGKRL